MQAMILAAPPHSRQVSMSISPKAPTVGEYALETLRPAHRRRSFGAGLVLRVICGLGVIAFAPLRGRDEGAVFAVRRKHAVESCQVHSGFGHQRRQLCNEVQRLKDDMRRAVPVRCLQLVAHVAVRRQRQPLFRHRWAADVPAQAFELLTFIGSSRHPGMQRKPGHLRTYQSVNCKSGFC